MRGDGNIGEGLMLLDVTEIASDLIESGVAVKRSVILSEYPSLSSLQKWHFTKYHSSSKPEKLLVQYNQPDSFLRTEKLFPTRCRKNSVCV